MTPQEVITRFMAELNANNYNYTSGVGKTILDAAVRSSSKFTSTQDVIDQMLADQTAAEKLAVEKVLGSAYAGKTMSEVSSSILDAAASTYDGTKISNANISADDYGYKLLDNMTVRDVINERKAYIFLENYCGIQLNANYFVGSEGYGSDSFELSITDATGKVIEVVTLTSAAADNVDTGAITGSDANITLKVGDVVNGSTLTSSVLSSLATKYGSAASLSGDTIVIGSGVEKDEESIVPEEGDMYLFTASGTAKNINTGKNGWVVNATAGSDTITSGGRDSINAGSGNDKIIAEADEATITTGAGSDTVEISASVKSVTITDLNSTDTISISGKFEVGSAQIENSMLVVTDKTGTRKIKFSDLTNVGNAKIGAQTISDWLSKSGYNISDIASGNISSRDVSDDISGDILGGGRVAIDSNYTPNINVANFETVEETQTISSATNINLDEITITNGTVKSGSTTVGTVSTVTPAVMNFTTHGLTVHVGDGTATSYNALTAPQKMMVAALFKWWAGEALNLNEESYELGFTSDTAKVTDITLSFQSLGGKTLALVQSSYRGDHQTDQLELQISTDYYNTFLEGDTNGTSTVEGAGFLDRTLAHEFTHAVMSTNINNFSTLPQFLKEGMAELTHGIDDERGNEIFALGYNASSLTGALNVNDTGTGTTTAYSGGFMFLRYFARQAALQTLTDDFVPGDITATVNLGTGNSTYYVSGNSTLETATTSKQDISLGSASGSTYTVGNTGVKQIINTGSTGKKIVGVTHNTTVTGGAGADTVEFVEGTLIDAGNGNNSIGGSGQFATITAGTGNDSVFVNGSENSISLGDGNNLLSIGGEATYDNSITAGSGNDRVIANLIYNSQINLGDGDNVINLAARNSTIQTGDGNDSLTFSYNNDSGNVISLGAGNDTVDYLSTNNTIDMGAGDDSVGSSGGNNVFLYNAESGNDTIWFFRENDTLAIAGDYATQKVFTYGSGAPYVDVRISLKSGDSVTGSILLKQALPSFTEAANIVTVEAADTTPSDEDSLLISLTANADTYNNTLDNATILALAGDDKITNSGASVYVDLGDGDDSINNTGDSVLIDAGDGKNNIVSRGKNVTILGGTGDDYIHNDSGNSTSIKSGAGNDTVNNEGSNVTIDGGTGNDTISNNGSNVTISGGDGNDTINNYTGGNSVTINAGAGSDYIFNNNGSTVTIDGGAGSDRIFNNNGSTVTIDGGSGSDTIDNYSGKNVTISGGTGDDQISLNSSAENNLIEYTSGDGNDTIKGFDGNDTLQIGGGSGTYSKATVDNDVIVTVGDGSILLVGAASLTSVNIDGTDKTPDTTPAGIFTEGDDIYTNTLAGATLQALGGNDSITNQGENVYIDGMGGNDTVINRGSNTTISGGDGADYLYNSYGTKNVTISGGNGNDTISNIASPNVSINGGAGNDSILNNGHNSTIDGGDGKDTVKNEHSNNVSINTGDGDDSVTNNSGKNVTINTGAGNDDITNLGAEATIYGGAGNDSISNYESKASIDGGDGNDYIHYVGSEMTIDGGEDDDLITGHGSVISINAGTGDDTVGNGGDSVTIDAGDGNDSIENLGGTYAKIFGGDGNDTIRNVTSKVIYSRDSIDVYLPKNPMLDGGAGDDLIYNLSGSNATIIGGDGNDRISLGSEAENNLIQYTEGDGDDVVWGFNGDDMLQIGGGSGTYSTQVSGKDILVTVGDGSILLKDAASLKSVNINGADKTPDTTPPATPVTGIFTEGDDTYRNTVDNVQLLALGGNDKITNRGANVLIDGMGGNDSINNYSSKVTISGGVGADSLYNAYNAKNVTISGGDDNDTIENYGKNISIDGGSGNDSIENQGSNVTIRGDDGADYLENRGNRVIVDAGTGNDTVKNFFALEDSINAGSGNDYILLYGTSYSTIDGGDGNDTIENVYGSNYNRYNGGDGDDYISTDNNTGTASWGGDSNTINGGRGNDTIHIGTSSTLTAVGTIVEYADGDGDDVIDTRNGNSYKIKLTSGTLKETLKSGSDIILKIGTGSITLKDASGSYNLSVSGNIINVDSKYATEKESVVSATKATLISDATKRTHMLINGSPYDDKLYNNNDENTINGGDGNDQIYLIAHRSQINGGDGDDSIWSNFGYMQNTLDGGAGNDSIENYGNEDFILGGDGNDTIINSGVDVTIAGGKGDDSIELHFGSGYGALDNVIQYTEGDGNDTVWGFNATATLSISGEYSAETVGKDILVTVGDGSVLLKNAASLTSVNIVSVEGGDPDKGVKIYNNTSDTLITSGAGDDTIYNDGIFVTIAGGDGNDSIHNLANFASIETGDGNDTVHNGVYAMWATINTGNGDDYVLNGWMNSSEAKISLGAGNDTLANHWGDSITVNGGTGNDLIKIDVHSKEAIIEYASGDGDDTIYGFNPTDTLSLTGGAITGSVVSGDDLILKVDTGSIKFVNTRSVNVNGEIFNPSDKTGTNGHDFLTNFDDNATVTGLGGSDKLANSGDNVSIVAGEGDNSIGNYGENTTIVTGDGDNTIYNRGKDSQIIAGAGNDSIHNGWDSSTIDAGDGNDTIVNHYASLIKGGAGDDVIRDCNDGTLEDGIAHPLSTLIGGTGNDTIYALADWESEELIVYTLGDGDDVVYGFSPKDTLQIGGTDTYSTTKSGKDILVTVGDGSILLVGAASLSSVNITGTDEEETPTEYKFSWTFADGKATYTRTSGTTSETVFTLTGLSEDFSEDDVTIDGNKIILSASALNQKNITLTASGDYSLELGEDVPTVTKTEKSWTLDGTTATYHDTGKSEGYKLTNSKTVTYTAPVAGKSLLTVTDLASGLEVDDLTENLTVNGKILTVTPDVVGDEFSISGGYKVVFAAGSYDGSKFTGTDGKDTIEVNGSGLEIDGGKGNDTITSNNSGNVYLFDSDSGKDVVKGYGSDDTIKITDDSTVTASLKGSDVIIKAGSATMTLKNAANGTQVTVVDSDDKTLIDETFYSDRIVKDNGATLTSAFKSKSFETEDPIQIVDASATSVKFSLTGGDEDNTLIGGKGANFINGNGGENLLTGGKGNDTFATGNGIDTITDYETTDKISLAADVSGFSVNGGDVILSFDDENSLTIQNAADKKITFLKNKKSSTEIFSSNGKTNTTGTSITLASSTKNYTATAKMLTIDGGLTDDVWIVGNTKANKIFGGDGDDTIFGNGGNDTLTGGDGDDIFIYETGKDTITDYETSDKISLAAAPTSETLNSKGDVVLKFGTNSLTIKNGGGKSITFADDTTKIYYNESIVGSDGVTLQSTFKDSIFTADDFAKVDASATTRKLTLTGSDDDNTLIGGKGANLISGGKGDDLLIGKGGADTFVYSSGDDTIGDYGTGSDKISLSSEMKDFDLSGDNVIIGFGDGDSLTIQDAAGKSISFLETVSGKVKTQINVFAPEGIFNSGKTALTLAADTSNFDAKSYSALVTIDGGLTDEISILGNTKNNVIIAGNGDSTLNGGKGNDTLWGGDGSDTFIYESGGGKDVIYGFGDDDMLQIGGTFTTSVKGSDISFKVGSQKDALILKDTSATSFNINGSDYAVSGNTLTKR